MGFLLNCRKRVLRVAFCIATGVAAFVVGCWLLPNDVSPGPALALHGELAGVQATDSYTVMLPLITRPLLAPPEDGLGAVNYYRALAGLPPALEDEAYSQGAWYHARYMVKNDYLGHGEDPDNRWYTPEGAQAGANSNLMVSTNAGATDRYAVEVWVQGPFHLVAVIDPALREIGYGSYREDIGTWRMGAVLDVLRGLGSVPATTEFPVYYPEDNAYLPVLEHRMESPSPLTSCPGYTVPSGPPIVLQIGDGRETPRVTDASLWRDGVEVAHCVFDETSYRNPDASLQALGRSILDGRDAIVAMPREPLVPGSVYTVSITASGSVYRWSFAALNLAETDSPLGPL